MTNLTLSWILVGMVVFVGTILLVYNPNWGIYNGIIDNNGGTNIEDRYLSAYVNLTANQSGITDLAYKMSNTTSLWSVFTNAGVGLVNTLAIGLSAINVLVQVPTYINQFNAVLEGVSLIPSPFWGIIETAIVIICIALLIRAARGTILEP